MEQPKKSTDLKDKRHKTTHPQSTVGKGARKNKLWDVKTSFGRLNRNAADLFIQRGKTGKN